MTKKFSIVVFKQSRVVLSIFAFAILFLPVLILPSHIDDNLLQITVTVVGILALFGLLFYFSYGRLTVTLNDENLHFEWRPKLLFNYARIPEVKLSEINRLVIDQGEVLRKISTHSTEITLGHNRPNNLIKSDAQEFIAFLTGLPGNYKVVDSWDVWAEKGYLKWALRINTGILIGSVGILIFYAATKGFNQIPSASFFLLLFILPQTFLYQKQLKSKS